MFALVRRFNGTCWKCGHEDNQGRQAGENTHGSLNCDELCWNNDHTSRKIWSCIGVEKDVSIMWWENGVYIITTEYNNFEIAFFPRLS